MSSVDLDAIVTCLFFFSRPGAHLDLHSFPTRRSSDLIEVVFQPARRQYRRERADRQVGLCPGQVGAHDDVATAAPRSEEHTSELQSRVDLVCRLLLEKKNVMTGLYRSFTHEIRRRWIS